MPPSSLQVIPGGWTDRLFKYIQQQDALISGGAGDPKASSGSTPPLPVVLVEGPYGSGLQSALNMSNVALCATGTGVVPMLSLLREVAASGKVLMDLHNEPCSCTAAGAAAAGGNSPCKVQMTASVVQPAAVQAKAAADAGASSTEAWQKQQQASSSRSRRRRTSTIVIFQQTGHAGEDEMAGPGVSSIAQAEMGRPAALPSSSQPPGGGYVMTSYARTMARLSAVLGLGRYTASAKNEMFARLAKSPYAIFSAWNEDRRLHALIKEATSAPLLHLGAITMAIMQMLLLFLEISWAANRMTHAWPFLVDHVLSLLLAAGFLLLLAVNARIKARVDAAMHGDHFPAPPGTSRPTSSDAANAGTSAAMPRILRGVLDSNATVLADTAAATMTARSNNVPRVLNLFPMAVNLAIVCTFWGQPYRSNLLVAVLAVRFAMAPLALFSFSHCYLYA